MKADEADTKKTGDMTNTRVGIPENGNLAKNTRVRGYISPARLATDLSPHNVKGQCPSHGARVEEVAAAGPRRGQHIHVLDPYWVHADV